MTAQSETTQRDLPVPLRRRRRFVPRGEFEAMSRTAPDISWEAFRTDQDATADQERNDPYAQG